MPWQHYTTQIEQWPAQVLIDVQFRQTAPLAQLPQLARFGVFCRQEPGGSFWHPDESEPLDKLEDDLFRLCQEHGHGWAVYVLRIATPGLREYFLYFGGHASLARAHASLRSMHLDYRIDYDEGSDPGWSRYKSLLPSEPAA